MLEEAKLQSLEQAIGLAGTQHLVDMLKDDLRNRPPVILRMIELDQRDALLAEAHALKGATLNIGATHIGDVARRIEEACENGDALDRLGRELTASARATRIAIDEREKRRQRA